MSLTGSIPGRILQGLLRMGSAQNLLGNLRAVGGIQLPEEAPSQEGRGCTALQALMDQPF